MTGRRIEVVDYQASWPSRFNAEKHLLAEMIGETALVIEHIGSTSVPGLPAKPIIDILIEVPKVSLLDDKSIGFEQLGYEVKGENGIAGRRYFQKGGNARSHHIHAFETGSNGLMRHRAFKYYLIAHPEKARAYADIKKQAAKNCHHDNEVYISLKNDFIVENEKLAVQWYQKQ